MASPIINDGAPAPEDESGGTRSRNVFLRPPQASPLGSARRKARPLLGRPPLAGKAAGSESAAGGSRGDDTGIKKPPQNHVPQMPEHVLP